jgi:hypothetical protein
MSAIPAILAALCLRPSARYPPPIDVLLKTKAKPKFDRAVTELSKAVFPFFDGPIWAQFQPRFPVSAVRSAEGRKPFKHQILSTSFCSLALADCCFSSLRAMLQYSGFASAKQ